MHDQGDTESTEEHREDKDKYGPQMNTDGTQINTGEASGSPSNPYAAPQTVTKKSPKPFADRYYLRASFWVAVVVGWFVASCVLFFWRQSPDRRNWSVISVLFLVLSSTYSRLSSVSNMLTDAATKLFHPAFYLCPSVAKNLYFEFCLSH
jgi:hypothetical protein